MSISAEDYWICYTRPMIIDGTVVAWAPGAWGPEAAYAVSASRYGVLIGEVYLHQIPAHVLTQANDAWLALSLGDIESATLHATHQRVRKGSGWKLLPLQVEKELVND